MFYISWTDSAHLIIKLQKNTHFEKNLEYLKRSAVFIFTNLEYLFL